MLSLSLNDPLAASLAGVAVDAGSAAPRTSEPAATRPTASVPERRSVMEVAAEGLFDIFGFEVGASASFDPLCEFVNPLLDEEHQLNCGEKKRRRRAGA